MHINLKKAITESSMGKSGLIILLIMILMAALAPLISFYDPLVQSTASFLPPSCQNWLGTNHVGQDIWSQLVYGARTSLLVGFGVGIFSTLLAISFGTSAAIIGGLYSKIIMRLVDAFIVLPTFIVLILVTAYVKPGVLVLTLLLSLLMWQDGARILRAQVLSLKRREHINAVRAFGGGGFYITCRHILPDLSPIIMVDFIHGVRRAIFIEAGLAFLGISNPYIVSWGTMMREAMSFSYLRVWQWWLLPVGAALSLTIIGLTFISHAAEPVIEPRLRGAVIATN